MRTDQEVTGLVRDWLSETLSSVPPPEATVAEVLRRLPSTPQANAPRAGTRTSQPSAVPVSGGWGMLPLAGRLGLAGIAVAASVAAGFVLRDQLPSLIGQPSPSPTPSPVASGARTLVVDPSGSTGYRSIGDAVRDALDGDTVVVRPGRYAERVVIRTDITIVGDGPREAIVVRAIDGPADPQASPAGPVVRSAFVLEQSDAVIRGLSITGPEVASAVWIHGGAPTLEDLTIDLDGDQAGADPNSPHENLLVDAGSRATIRRTTFDGFVSIEGGSRVTFADNAIDGGCIYLSGRGTDATVRDNTVRDSGCPTFGIGVHAGAAPLIEGNTIDGGIRMGIEISGDGTQPIVRSNTIRGLAMGIWAGGSADPVVEQNVLEANDIGITLAAAHGTVRDNRVEANKVGIMLTADADPDLVGNRLLRNDVGIRSDGAKPGIEVRGGAWCANGQDLEVRAGPTPTVTAEGGCDMLPTGTEG